MLRLEQVSKIYSANGVISTGFSKVSLEFNIGEFVAITGESGSGKSTLLNVISGLDSYEEGEMYILNKPTSGFTTLEIEDYRKEYIGNIFQNFNLINSYTVYENVELVLLLSGVTKEEAKPRVLELIEKVGLLDFKNTKASKLSGGQKQRVAIARALAKDTPIIVADEPTGNIDLESAKEIIKLLHDISSEKLVIIVTHNFDQVEPYVTRKIQMHDGRVVEDKEYIETNACPEKEVSKAISKNLSFKNMFSLGVKNTFNLPAKFMLLLLVFVFMWTGIVSSFTSSKNLIDEIAQGGYNTYFNDVSGERVVISKKDKSPISQKDIEALSKVSNVDKVMANDLIIDGRLMLENAMVPPEENNIYVNVLLRELHENSKFSFVNGEMPKKNNQGVLQYNPEENQYFESQADDLLKTKVAIFSEDSHVKMSNHKIKVTGICQTNDTINRKHSSWVDAVLYLPEKNIEEVQEALLENHSKQTLLIGQKEIDFTKEQGPYYLKVDKNVPKGQLFIPEDLSAYEDFNAVGKSVKLTNETIYFKDTFSFTIGKVYKEDDQGNIHINPYDYKKFFQKESFQASIFLKDEVSKVATMKKLNDLGYRTLDVANSKVEFVGDVVVSKIIYSISMAFTILVLFIVIYFIIKLILKSRNTYFSIIRMLGATKKNCASMLKVELFMVYNIAFAIGLFIIGLVKGGLISWDYLVTLANLLSPLNLAVLYLVMLAMTLLLARRYARKIFKDSAMDAYREEV